jgi:hypothetical protein
MGEANRRGSKEKRILQAIKQFEILGNLNTLDPSEPVRRAQYSKALKSYFPLLGFALTKKRFPL